MADVLQIVGQPHPVAHEVAQLLVRHDIPDPVTGQNDELISLRAILHPNLRFGGYELLALSLTLYVFILEVTERSRHRQRAVDALDHDAATGVLDTLLL